ncbi:uncharacterized protein [Nicotiana tomentosiformis]|uniref:uncharacterized protein n=1 Tax=Nicotiana tomentosiformis TaxID=4098 RepID=UPI00388CA37D
MESRVRRFVEGLSSLVINEAATATLNSDMNYGKMVAFSQATKTRKLKNRMERESSNKDRSAGNFSSTTGGCGGGGRIAFKGRSSGSSKYFSQSSVSTPPSGPSEQQGNRFRPSQGNRGSYQQGRSGGRFQQQRRPPCPRCGKMHFGTCYMDQPICYGCGILTVQSHNVYAIIDPGSTFSYVTPYVAMEFGIEPEQLHESFSVSTLVGESIVVAWVYRDYVVTVRGRDTMADLIELGMVDFDVIMGMD